MPEFGPYEPTRNEQVLVGVTSAVISESRSLSPQNKRKVILIRNTSPNTVDIIYVWFSSSGVAASNSGIRLLQGESVVDSSDSGYDCFQDKITAICATANGTVSVYER